MKKFGFSTIAAGGLTAAILGLAAPAQAATINDAPTALVSATTIATDLGHQTWVNNMQQQGNVHVPHVDTTVRQSR